VNISTTLILPNILLTDKFGITVAESCSGIESIALFSGLYIIVGLLDRERLNIRRYIWVFPAALAMLFALNIVRVFALIAAGYYINAEFAFSLFHTYAGLIFFILYSVIFWAAFYRYLMAPSKGK
jgi:exosortase/archaeosortase family protein